MCPDHQWSEEIRNLVKDIVDSEERCWPIPDYLKDKIGDRSGCEGITKDDLPPHMLKIKRLIGKGRLRRAKKQKQSKRCSERNKTP